MKLLIVESKAKCSTIAGFFPSGTLRCVASGGHIRETAGGLACLSADYMPAFKSKKDIRFLRKAAKDATEVVLGTDDDREGEAIAWHLCVVLGLPLTTPRAVFREITSTALHQALASPRQLDMATVDAQLARSVVDMLVGFKVSPALWKLVSGNHTGLSAGRCQTPALRLVAEADQASPIVPVHSVSGSFSCATCGSVVESPDLSLSLSTEIDDDTKLREFAKATVSHEHRVVVGDTSEHRVPPPAPFTTSRMQQAASNALGLSPKATMAAAGNLYSAGLITYPRTDSVLHSKEFQKTATGFIGATYGKHQVAARAAPTAQAAAHAQEAHEAVRCSQPSVTQAPASLAPNEKRLYQLVWQNAIQQHMVDAAVLRRAITVTAPCSLKYAAWPEVVNAAGWMATLDRPPGVPAAWRWASAHGHDAPGALDLVSARSSLSGKGGPRYLTESGLVNALEEKGIGRPSTFAGIIATLTTRKYATLGTVEGVEYTGPVIAVTPTGLTEAVDTVRLGRQSRKLVATDLGRQVLGLCDAHFGAVFAYQYTARLEEELDRVASGHLSRARVCDGVSRGLDEALGSCPTRPAGGTGDELGVHDGSPITLHRGRYGPYVKWRDQNYSLSGRETTLEVAVALIQRTRRLTGGWTVLPGKEGRSDYGLRAKKGKGKALTVSLAAYPGDHLTDASGEVVAWLESSRR
jgi:DNA topoisomerase-1